MRHLLYQSRLFLMVSFLLSGLLLLTLPVSYAVWREVLGAAVEVELVSEATATILASSTPSIATAMPTVTPLAPSTAAPTLQAVLMTIVSDTVVPTSNIDYEAPPAGGSTNLPPPELVPTDTLAAEEPATAIPPTEELPTTESPQAEPPVEAQPPSR